MWVPHEPVCSKSLLRRTLEPPQNTPFSAAKTPRPAGQNAQSCTPRTPWGEGGSTFSRPLHGSGGDCPAEIARAPVYGHSSEGRTGYETGLGTLKKDVTPLFERGRAA